MLNSADENLMKNMTFIGFLGGAVVKNSLTNAGDARDAGSIPGLGRFPEEGSGNPLQYSHLKNSMDLGALQVTAHGVGKSQTLPSTHTAAHLLELPNIFPTFFLI